jgi:hypothetical protein
MAHPSRVTFPGSVRFATKPAEGEPAWQEPHDEKGKPIKCIRNSDARGEFTGTTVTVPVGKRLVYDETPGNAVFGGITRPTYVVRMVDDVGEAVHAELEHRAKDGEHAAHVVATSTKHVDEDGKPIAGVGVNAADAVRRMKMAIAEKSAKERGEAEKKPEEKPADEKPAEGELVERTG